MTLTLTTTLAWHNNPQLKAEVVVRLHQHRTEDSIIKGLYQRVSPTFASGYRGCAIGCTLPHLDDEPRPRPEPPQMNGLFERPERRTRMFVQPELQREVADA